MSLNNEDKFRLALDLFKSDSLNKKEIVEDGGKIVKIDFDYHFAFTEEESFRKLTKEVFDYLDNYPELKQELKEKYFN